MEFWSRTSNREVRPSAPMRRGTARDVVAHMRHAPGEPAWDSIEIVIRHRGAPRNERGIKGARITAPGASFVEVDQETSIPYHRILRIRAGGRLRYERFASSGKTS